MSDYNIFDHFWIVEGNEAQAWSSATAAYVANWPDDGVTRILDETELTDVLRPYGLRGPVMSAIDVRAEARRRMMRLLGARDAAHLDVLISNGSREAIRLLRKGAGNWTSDETIRAAKLEAVDEAIEKTRAASNALEVMVPVPKDFQNKKYWAGSP